MSTVTTNEPHILIVEDDLELAEWMQDYLSKKAFRVTVSHRGDEAVRLIHQDNPDVVVLDGMLPGLDGVDVCKVVRATFSNAIIMLTARDEEIDEVLGLEMGADEYLTKPVRARALLARIRKHLERQLPTSVHRQDREYLHFNRLSIDRQARSVLLDGVSLNISTNEFDVLWILAQQAGQIVYRSELVSQLRGFDYDGFDRSMDLKVSRLRKKLGDNSAEPVGIKTIWGKGYLFVKDAW